MACAIEDAAAGLRSVLVDKGCLCNSIFHYPSHMTFFTTPELPENWRYSVPSVNQKPTRNEALEYYRKVAEHYRLECPALSKCGFRGRFGWRFRGARD